jgi:hypothetical protein
MGLISYERTVYDAGLVAYYHVHEHFEQGSQGPSTRSVAPRIAEQSQEALGFREREEREQAG